MAEITLLVTCVGGGLSAQFIRLLTASQRHTIRVVGVDMQPDPVARHFADAFETVPAGTDPKYPEVMASICRKHGVNLIFPGSDEEALTLSAHKAMLKSIGVIVACNDPQVLEVITDKIATYRVLEKLGCVLPVWRACESVDALANDIDEVVRDCGQAVVKLPQGRGGRGTFVLDPKISEVHPMPGSRELHMNRELFLAGPAREIKWDGPVLVMERLKGPAFDIDILAWQGKALTLIPRRRHTITAPNDGHVIVDEPVLKDVARKVVAELNMSWLFDIDFMLNANDQPVPLEVNPRASGSVSVGMSSGVPLMDDLVSLAVGEPVSQKVPVWGRRIFAYNALAAA